MRFRDSFWFLSNMYPHPVMFEGVTYPCAEAAFQAAKCANAAERAAFESLNGFNARKLGRTVTLRADWDEVRVDIMREILENKFSDPRLLARLRRIEGTIAEDNTWGDTFWGVCRGRGHNVLGRLLMEIRDR